MDNAPMKIFAGPGKKKPTRRPPPMSIADGAPAPMARGKPKPSPANIAQTIADLVGR